MNIEIDLISLKNLYIDYSNNIGQNKKEDYSLYQFVNSLEEASVGHDIFSNNKYNLLQINNFLSFFDNRKKLAKEIFELLGFPSAEVSIESVELLEIKITQYGISGLILQVEFEPISKNLIQSVNYAIEKTMNIVNVNDENNVRRIKDLTLKLEKIEKWDNGKLQIVFKAFYSINGDASHYLSALQKEDCYIQLTRRKSLFSGILEVSNDFALNINYME